LGVGVGESSTARRSPVPEYRHIRRLAVIAPTGR
jgi:hypothetical protein